jgi:hypothetical protein
MKAASRPAEAHRPEARRLRRAPPRGERVSTTTNRPTPLLEAAAALEEELRRRSEVAKEAQRLPLDTRENLERTAASLAELARADERLAPLVHGLLGAVGKLVEVQQAEARALETRTAELTARRETFERLMADYGALGKDAQALNAMVQEVAVVIASGAGGAAPEPAAIARIGSAMARLVDGSERVAAAARAERFEELARDADALKSQLLFAREKLAVFEAKGGGKDLVH